MKKILIVDDQISWQSFNKNAVYKILGENLVLNTASSAYDGYNLLLENIETPFDIILTDMQMEEDYAPKMAGEWLIEQVRNLSQYKNTKIIIISATANIKHIAESYGVNYIPKSVAVASLDVYKLLLL